MIMFSPTPIAQLWDITETMFTAAYIGSNLFFNFSSFTNENGLDGIELKPDIDSTAKLKCHELYGVFSMIILGMIGH